VGEKERRKVQELEREKLLVEAVVLLCQLGEKQGLHLDDVELEIVRFDNSEVTKD
jgi:hypothetical protein